MRTADLAGWAGALTLVAAYAAMSSGALSPASRLHAALNGLGSVGLAAVAADHRAWPSFVLNVLWLVIAATSVIAPALRARRDDRAAARQPLPALLQDGLSS